MQFHEKQMDLFSVDSDFYLAHCISGDFALGKGIAVEFDRRFDMQIKLKTIYPNYRFIDGNCLPVDNVFNLVTKERYNHKPTYNDIYYALLEMKYEALKKGVKKIAMPRIGCGLDRKNWSKVSCEICKLFADTDIEILVCYTDNKPKNCDDCVCCDMRDVL